MPDQTKNLPITRDEFAACIRSTDGPVMAGFGPSGVWLKPHPINDPHYKRVAAMRGISNENLDGAGI